MILKKIKLNLQVLDHLRCIEVAIQHLIDDLEDAYLQILALEGLRVIKKKRL